MESEQNTGAQSRTNMVENLREQAASYRRLAAVARTSAGTKSLRELADNFDDQASKLDPLSRHG